MSAETNWYILKNSDGTCQIITADGGQVPDPKKSWGPFHSQEQAIASRVGLIRQGKCQPI